MVSKYYNVSKTEQTLQKAAAPYDSISLILVICSVLLRRVNYLRILIIVWNLKLVQVALGVRVPFVVGCGVYSW